MILQAMPYPGGATQHAYWRVQVVSTSGGVFARLGEVEFRATPGGADQVPDCTTADMSPNGIVISDQTGIPGSETWKAFDDDTSTVGDMSASGLPKYIGFQFPTAKAVEQVSIYTGVSPNAGPITALNIDYSDDGSTWTTRAFFSGLSLSFLTTYLFDVPSSRPSFTTPPTVTTDSGFHGVGDTATVSYAVATTGADFGGATVTRQWMRDGSPISGATGLSYTYVTGDAPHNVWCDVTATNSAGSTTLSSSSNAVVTPTFATEDWVTTNGAEQMVTTVGAENLQFYTRTA